MGALGEVRGAPQVQFGGTATVGKSAVDANPRLSHPVSPRVHSKNITKTALPVAKDAALSQANEQAPHASTFAATNGHLPPKKDEPGMQTTQIPRSPEERNKHFKALLEKATSDHDIVKIASGMVGSPIHCVLFLKAAASDNPAKIIEFAQKLHPTHPDFALTLLKSEGMKPDSAERLLVEPQIKAKIAEVVSGENKENGAKDLVKTPRFMEYLKDNPLDAAKLFCALRDQKVPLKEASEIEKCITESLHGIESKMQTTSAGLGILEGKIQKLKADPQAIKERITIEAKYVELNKQLSDLAMLRKDVLTAKIGTGDGGMMTPEQIEALAHYKPSFDKETVASFLKTSENSGPIFKNARYSKTVNESQKNVKAIGDLHAHFSADRENEFKAHIQEVISAHRSLSSEASRKIDTAVVSYHENSVQQLSDTADTYRPYLTAANSVARDLDDLMQLKQQIDSGKSTDLKQLASLYEQTKAKFETKYQEMAKLNLDPDQVQKLKAAIEPQLDTVKAMLPLT